MKSIVFFTALLAALLAHPAWAGDRLLAAGKGAGNAAQVVLLRGFANVFSHGMDQIARKLAARGVRAQVISHGGWRRALDDIVAARKLSRQPVILIGHSLGANRAVDLARELERRSIRVDYLATLAATRVNTVPANVLRATNYHFAGKGWGEPARRGAGFRGVLRNVDVSTSRAVGHFNIDENDALQEQLVRDVLRHARGKRRG